MKIQLYPVYRRKKEIKHFKHDSDEIAEMEITLMCTNPYLWNVVAHESRICSGCMRQPGRYKCFMTKRFTNRCLDIRQTGNELEQRAILNEIAIDIVKYYCQRCSFSFKNLQKRDIGDAEH